MDDENDAVCEKIINEIDLVFQNDSDLYVKCFFFLSLSLYDYQLTLINDFLFMCAADVPDVPLR